MLPSIEAVDSRVKLGNARPIHGGDGTPRAHARAALELAERVGNDALTSRCVRTVAELMLYAGEQGAIPCSPSGRCLPAAARPAISQRRCGPNLARLLPPWAGYVGSEPAAH